MPAKKKAPSKSNASKRSTKSKNKSTTTSAKKRSTAKKVTAKTTAPKKRTAGSKSAVPSKAGDMEVTIDRRRNSDRRDENSDAVATDATQPQLEKREKVQRRRQIDPTTCERDYSEAEVEFMNAMDEYKRTSGRMFPTCSEVLEVIRELGYVQQTPAEMATAGPATVEPLANSEPSSTGETSASGEGFREGSDLDVAEFAL